jgi:hypothetical protein
MLDRVLTIFPMFKQRLASKFTKQIMIDSDKFKESSDLDHRVVHK